MHVLPIKDLKVTADGTMATSYEFCKFGHFRVFGFPCIAKNLIARINGKAIDSSSSAERGY